jgi:hypothetical protein
MQGKGIARSIRLRQWAYLHRGEEQVTQVKKTGGPAFPQHIDGAGFDLDPGMTLRDWFAGMALQGLLASGKCRSPEDAYEGAYKYADEMLKAREE